MRYVDGCLLLVPKRNLQAIPPRTKRLERSGASTARLSIENVPATILTHRDWYRFRER
jgi:hypothetical protein